MEDLLVAHFPHRLGSNSSWLWQLLPPFLLFTPDLLWVW